MKTNKEIRFENWRGHGPLIVPQGQPVSPTSHNQYFVESFGNLFDKNSMQYHDATHYGIRVNAEDVEMLAPWTCGCHGRAIHEPGDTYCDNCKRTSPFVSKAVKP